VKRIIYFTTLLGIMLVLSFSQGCGSGEDLSEKAAPETATPQKEIEQTTGLPPGGTSNRLQETVSLATTETQTTVQDIIDEIIIENQGYESDKKGSVKFSHGKHYREYTIDCVQCHHVYQDGENIWKEEDSVKKCVVCHDQNEERDNVFKLQKAFHENCRVCHSKVSMEGKEAPYNKCSGCHG